jgi:hypothetical protein
MRPQAPIRVTRFVAEAGIAGIVSHTLFRCLSIF